MIDLIIDLLAILQPRLIKTGEMYITYIHVNEYQNTLIFTLYIHDIFVSLSY